MSYKPYSSEPERYAGYRPPTAGQRTPLTRPQDPRIPLTTQPPSPSPGQPHLQLPPLSNLQLPPRTTYPPTSLPPSSLPGGPPGGPQSTFVQPSPLMMQTQPEIQPGWQAPMETRTAGPVSSFPHPQLFAQRSSFQSRNPGTVYEALSPVEHHETSGQSSLFNEAGYRQTAYPSAPISSFQSPTGSHNSSTTSSSGVASSSHHSSGLPTGAPASTGASNPPASMAERYVLTVRQQPRAARACGFGERDRRVIDPPPIVQLALKDYDPTSSTDIEELRFPFNIVHCALLSAGPQDPQSLTSAPSTSSASSADVTAVPDPAQSNRISRRLMGTLVASPFVGTDPEMPTSSVENASLATFFIFQDLSCRQNGRYKLLFTLMKVPLGPNLVEGGQGRVVGSVESEEFDVFSAKEFPGMRPSTLLTRDLKRQGAGVSVKKGKGFLGAGSDKRADTESGSDDDADSETRPRKRRT